MPVPTSEERLSITRGAVVTFFSTVSDWPFQIPDISPLWDGEDVVLVNRQIPGSTDAEVPYPPAPAPSRRPVQAIVSGHRNLTGVAVTGFANRRAQLMTNVGHLMTNVIKRLTTGDGTVSVELFGPGGSSIGVKPAQFIGPLRTMKDTPTSAIVTLDLYFPKGVFAL